MEIALSAICGGDDIITPITPIDEATRVNLGYMGAQNYSGTKYFNHMSSLRVKELVGADIWKNYYKFCFERNPWDKVISWYYWEINHSKPNMKFQDFMESKHFASVGGPGGYDLYTDTKGDVIVDDVFLYENMDQAISKIEKIIGVSLPALPKAKSQFRGNREPYTGIYSEYQKRLVKKAFKREIALFKYHF